jgi:dGTPase
MPVTRVELEQRERQLLAPYAQFSADSRGRVHEESPPEWRTHFQRDRDRVIHSRAFRRLEYKTQVFLNGTGDHLRTRLTHTMEVAGISRNIARALGLNEDLTEAISLAHDLGHSPFGHKGETALNDLMKDHGGFEHNRQSLRVVDFIEQKYPRFPGLNLTWEIREGMVKHLTSYDHPEPHLLPLPPRREGERSREALPSTNPSIHQSVNPLQPSLEAQVANLADEITYYSHDIDDGLTAGLFREDRLRKDVKIWDESARSVAAEYGDLPDESRRYFIIRCIIDAQVKDVVHTTEANVREARIKTADDVRRQGSHLVQYSPELGHLNGELRDYLYKNLYFNPEVHEPNRRAVRMLEELFRYYLDHPTEIGELSRKRAEHDGWPRAICDYLAGMTDRYALLEHRRIFKGE